MVMWEEFWDIIIAYLEEVLIDKEFLISNGFCKIFMMKLIDKNDIYFFIYKFIFKSLFQVITSVKVELFMQN